MYNAIQSTDSARRVIDYVLNPKQDQHGDRCVYAAGIGCSVQTVKDDFADTIAEHGREDLRVEAYSAVISASKEEFDSEDPEQIYQFHLMSQEAFRRTFPGRQGLVGTQIDGDTGLVHSHWIISNVAHEDAEMIHTVQGRQVTEQVVAGRPFSSRMSNIFRIRAVTNQVLADEHFMASIGYRNERLGALMKDRAGLSGRRFDGLIGEHAYDNAELVRATRTSNQWLAALKERISRAGARAVDEDDFRQLLTEDGSMQLAVRGKQQVYSYRYTDVDGVTRTARAGGNRISSAEGGRETVLATIENNRRAALAQAREVGLPGRVRAAATSAVDQYSGDRGMVGDQGEIRAFDTALAEDRQGPISLSRDCDDELVYEFRAGGAGHRVKAADLGGEFTRASIVDTVRAGVAARDRARVELQLEERTRRRQDELDAEAQRQRGEMAQKMAARKAKAAALAQELDDEADRFMADRRLPYEERQAKAELERQQLLAHPPGRFAGLSETRLAALVDRLVVITDDRLNTGALYGRGLTYDEVDYVRAAWMERGRTGTVTEAEPVAAEAETLPATEPLVEHRTGMSSAVSAAAAVGQPTSSTSVPGRSTSAAAGDDDGDGGRPGEDDAAAPVPPPGPGPRAPAPFRSGLRRVRLNTASKQQRVDALAEHEEAWHDRMPDVESEPGTAHQEFVRGLAQIGVGSKMLSTVGNHLDPEYRRRLDLYVDKTTARSTDFTADRRLSQEITDLRTEEQRRVIGSNNQSAIENRIDQRAYHRERHQVLDAELAAGDLRKDSPRLQAVKNPRQRRLERARREIHQATESMQHDQDFGHQM